MRAISNIKNDQRGVTGLVIVIVTVLALFLVGWSIDLYRVKVDDQELGRLADIFALSIATQANNSSDKCVITSGIFEDVKIRIWDVNRPNTTYTAYYYSSDEQGDNGIVKVFVTSQVPLFYTSSFLGGGTGVFSNNNSSEAKCTYSETEIS